MNFCENGGEMKGFWAGLCATTFLSLPTVAQTTAVAGRGPTSADKAESSEATLNPYGAETGDWRGDSRGWVSEPESGESPPQPEAKPEETTFETTPEDEVVDTGHVVPTSGGYSSLHNEEAAPYSVGGIQAQFSEETWFKFYGFLQTRYVSGRYHEAPGEQVGGAGFSLARARLFFYGRMTDWLRILMRVGANSEGEANFEQAFADFHWRRFTFRVGQFYLPLFQEQGLSPVSLLTLDFSAVGSVFDGGQTQGVRISYDWLPTRLHFFATDGLRTGFSEAGSSVVADVAASFRGETLLAGDSYGRFNSGSSFRGEEFAVLLGGGAHYQSGGQLRDDAVQLGSINGDVTVEGNGYNLHISGSVLNSDYDPEEGTERVWQYGFVAQGGWFMLPWTELYARYEALISETPETDEEVATQSLFRGVALGLNHFIWPARGIRAIADFTYYFDGTVGTPIQPNPNAGLFESVGSQWSLRAELNVLF